MHSISRKELRISGFSKNFRFAHVFTSVEEEVIVPGLGCQLHGAVRALDFFLTAQPSPACASFLIVKTTRLCFLKEERKGTMLKQMLLFQCFIVRSFLRNPRQQLPLRSHCSEICDVGHNKLFVFMLCYHNNIRILVIGKKIICILGNQKSHF